MTGNTKVWRAPLAGLASVAMIATMGVAASTANAAPVWKYGDDVTVTLDANGGKFGSAETKTLTDTTDATYPDYPADGVFDGANALYKNVPTYKNANTSGYARVFTGWYESKSGGEAVAPDAVIADGTTLYAHWEAVPSDETETYVLFDFSNLVSYDIDSNVESAGVIQKTANGIRVRLADGDTLAPWQYAAADVSGDGTVFQGEWSVDPATVKKGPDAIIPQTVNAVTVRVGSANGFAIYKDGVKADKTIQFDAALGSTVDGLVAYKTGAIANSWTLRSGSVDKTLTVEAGKVSPTLPSDISGTVSLFPNGPAGVDAAKVDVYTKYNKTYSKGKPTKSYFAQKGWPLAETVDEAPARAHATFKGWYNPAANDDKGINRNSAYISSYLTYVEGKEADPVPFDFGSKIFDDTDLYAVYTADAKYREITLDPNYDGADKVVVKIYDGQNVGDQIAAQTSISRDGYTLSGWWTDPVSEKIGGDVYKLDLDRAADSSVPFPAYGTYYAHWTADSKGGKQGLLAKLHLGYDNAWKANTDSDGYVATSWSKFVSAREDVLAALRKLPELKLTKDASIDKVYAAVEKSLSAEKADGFNRQLSGILSPLSKFPDVDYTNVNAGAEKDTAHATEVNDLYAKGVITGYPDGTFGWGVNVARQDFIVWLWRNAGSPKTEITTQFVDVDADTFGAEAISWAAAKGITEGYKNADGTTSFGYGSLIARQDAAAFLYRAAGSPKFNPDYSVRTFADVDASTPHAKEILWAYENKIANGFGGGQNTFQGLGYVYRQDAAAFISRVNKLA